MNEKQDKLNEFMIAFEKYAYHNEYVDSSVNMTVKSSVSNL